jgi:formylglycine-generating enzyme required for sulfatase activity
MMKFISAILAATLLTAYGSAAAQSVRKNTAPKISDIKAQTIKPGSSTGALAFTISDAQTAASSLKLSARSSNTKLVSSSKIILGGKGNKRTIKVTPTRGQSGTTTIKVTVSDGRLSASDTFMLTVNPAVPTDFALVPQGSFTMGDSLDDLSDAPTRTVTLDAFYMGKYEVTKAEWDEVRTWGLSNGYTFLWSGSGKASNHPVQQVCWYDIVLWCNARSQKEGLTPVYYTDDAQTTIYKTNEAGVGPGELDVTNIQVKWSANGYRLPTEAEWEKAARGGLSGNRFPWGDTINHSQANYQSTLGLYDYDTSGLVYSYHPTYATESMPYTAPVGAFAANGYGLYNMAGNVSELCWDLYGTYAAGSQTNPRVSSSDTHYRICRGGSWNNFAGRSRVAVRSFIGPNSNSFNLGFRVVRSLVP